MLLEIRHQTRFDYDHPVRESVMEVWMQPQAHGGQRLASFDLEVEPGAQLFSYIDAFGNVVHHFDVPQPHTRLCVDARSVVETTAPERLPDVLDRGEWDRLNSAYVQEEAFDFLRLGGFAEDGEALRAFRTLTNLDKPPAEDPLTALRRLNRTIYESFTYTQGATDADSPISAAIERRQGVCQDFAHIMITVARLWGVPARYVSGYLLTDRQARDGAEHGDRSDPDASHAWVEVFLPSLRWIGFDPTNDALTGERHVTVAKGRDYGDVPPTRGVFKGEADSSLSVAVQVRPARHMHGGDHQPLRTPLAPQTGAIRRKAAAGARERERLLAQQQQQQQ